MQTKEIPREQWPRYFDDFSKQHAGWIVDLELLGSDIGDQAEANGLPLVGISADTKDRENRLVIIVGGRPDADVTRIINAPQRVWVKQPKIAGDEAVEVESKDGVTTLLTFHHIPLEEAERQLPGEKAEAGSPLPADELPRRDAIPAAGDVTLRVIASVPNTAALYQLDHLVAALARETLWLTDAYFIGTTAYIQALRTAVLDGVDVRLLVPSASDVPLLRALSSSEYRPLLEAGVRVYEWNGSMLHAKTAVADGRWARVGSTNLNLSSWIGNWELVVAVEDTAFAEEMEEMYLDDPEQATEIVLSAKNQARQTAERPRRRRRTQSTTGSAGRLTAFWGRSRWRSLSPSSMCGGVAPPPDRRLRPALS